MACNHKRSVASATLVSQPEDKVDICSFRNLLVHRLDIVFYDGVVQFFSCSCSFDSVLDVHIWVVIRMVRASAVVPLRLVSILFVLLSFPHNIFHDACRCLSGVASVQQAAVAQAGECRARDASQLVRLERGTAWSTAHGTAKRPPAKGRLAEGPKDTQRPLPMTRHTGCRCAPWQHVQELGCRVNASLCIGFATTRSKAAGRGGRQPVGDQMRSIYLNRPSTGYCTFVSVNSKFTLRSRPCDAQGWRQQQDTN